MDELSLNILDIAYNSVRAKASLIEIHIVDSLKENIVDITIIDNGSGMSEETIAKVVDPFYTTRTTRKVGLGIPLFKENAELTGGYLKIDSTLGKGTKVEARFIKDNIDTPVMGDIVGTILTLIQADDKIDYLFTYQTDDNNFELDTRAVKDILEDVRINEPEIILWLKDYIKEGLKL